MDPYFDNIFTESFSNFTGFLRHDDIFKSNKIERLNEKIKNDGWNPSARVFVSKSDMFLEDGMLKFK